jgi:hypothetical protein
MLCYHAVVPTEQYIIRIVYYTLVPLYNAASDSTPYVVTSAVTCAILLYTHASLLLLPLLLLPLLWLLQIVDFGLHCC